MYNANKIHSVETAQAVDAHTELGDPLCNI